MVLFEIHGYILYVEIPWKIRRLFFEVKQHSLSVIRTVYVSLFGEERCLCCGRPSGAVPVCRQCISAELMEFIPQRELRCSVCGKMLVSEQSRCMACRESPVLLHTDGVLPLYPYRLWRKELLFEWKMQDKRALTPVFSAALFKAVEQLWGNSAGSPVVVPVPPRPGKIWNRGWDQIDDVCQFLDRRYGCTVLHLLERMTVKQQKKLDRAQRLEMKGKSYVMRPFYQKCLQKRGFPEQVILLDDVMTTGVTLESCASLLKDAGAAKVFVLTLFIVD